MATALPMPVAPPDTKMLRGVALVGELLVAVCGFVDVFCAALMLIDYATFLLFVLQLTGLCKCGVNAAKGYADAGNAFK